MIKQSHSPPSCFEMNVIKVGIKFVTECHKSDNFNNIVLFLTRNQRKILDDTLPIRYSGLSNNAHLELVTSQKSKKGKKISK